MIQFFKKTVMATTLAAATFASLVATPAIADPYHGGSHRGGGGVGAAVVGGILGLAIGAAIASDHHDRGYAPPVAYAPRYASQVAYQPMYQPYPYQPYAYQTGYAAPAYGIDPGWVWRDGWFWDRGGHRYYRDGRPGDHGEYARRGYGGNYAGYHDGGRENYRDGGRSGGHDRHD